MTHATSLYHKFPSYLSSGVHPTAITPTTDPHLPGLLRQMHDRLGELERCDLALLYALPPQGAVTFEVPEEQRLRLKVGEVLVFETSVDRWHALLAELAVTDFDGAPICFEVELTSVPSPLVLHSIQAPYEQAVAELGWWSRKNARGNVEYLGMASRHAMAAFKANALTSQVRWTLTSDNGVVATCYFDADRNLLAVTNNEEGLLRALARGQTDRNRALRLELARELVALCAPLATSSDSIKLLTSLYPTFTDRTRGVSGTMIHLPAIPAYPLSWSLQREGDVLQLRVDGCLAFTIDLN